MKGRQRFAAEEVRAIRMSPLKDAAIAAQFGVSHVAIWKMRNGQSYNWVDGNGLARTGPAGKLMPSQVRFIRETSLETELLSERFGLCKEMIRRIRRHECYVEAAV